MECLKENCIHHAVCALYTFSGYNSDECAFYETRPHGEWKSKNEKRYCSNCKKKAIYVPSVYGPRALLTDFCPNCGADMRKEGESN